MRKLCWGCAAVGLVALGLMQAADYACCHPETVVARCVVRAYQASACFGPILQAGLLLADRSVGTRDIDPAEVIDIPDEPEPVLVAEPCPAEPEMAQAEAANFGNHRGRLPGKIVIDDGDEPPLAMPEGPIQPEPNLERLVERVESQWLRDDTDVTTAFWQAPAGESRQMPYCADEEDSPAAKMPYAEELDAPLRRRFEPRIWNPFPPRGTEVGGHEESELSPHGNDCREDPAASQHIPGCVNPASKCPVLEKSAPSGGEPSEPPSQPEKKKGKHAEPPKAKRTFDESKLTPFAAPVKLDTMEFRPSDWGKHDVPLPPF